VETVEIKVIFIRISCSKYYNKIKRKAS